MKQKIRFYGDGYMRSFVKLGSVNYFLDKKVNLNVLESWRGKGVVLTLPIHSTLLYPPPLGFERL